MLFDFTKSLFENWLKQLISYAFQPIILFTGLAFIAMIVRTEIYSSLGFRVCKHDFPNLGPISMLLGDNPLNADPSLNNSIFYWWFPKPMKGQDFTKIQAVIPVPYDHFAADGSFCEAYGCMENRFIELPFLDPVADASRIRRFFNGSYVQLDGLLLIFAMVYLLSKFNEVAVATARFLTGTSGSLASARSSGLQAFKQMSGKVDDVLAKPYEALTTRARSTGGGLMHRLEQEYETRMERKLGKEALDDKKANQAVLDEVKRSYGMDHKELKADAEVKYEQALKTSLASLGLKDEVLSAKVKELSDKNYKNWHDEYAKILTKSETTSFNDLTEDQKKEVNKALKDKNMRELSNDARFAQDFKKAYFEAHQDMSGRGIGMLGKHSSLIRSFEEVDHQVDEYRKHKEEKRQTLGERLYAGYGNLATGGSWHDYVYSDPRLRTRDETLKDQQKEFERQKLKQEINRATVGAKEDVLRPEYLARLEAEKKNADYAYYKDLSNRKLKDDVYAKLSSGEDPVLMGDKFMRKQATDSQMRGMVDRATAVRNQTLEEDRYIRREDHYEMAYEKSVNKIRDIHKDLSTTFNRNDIKAGEIASLLEQRHAGSPKDAQKALKEYKEAVQEFETNQKILQEIDNRKASIKQEVDNYVNDINKYRKAAGMEEYRPKAAAEEPRKVKTIDQHLRGNA
jgi:type IV secretion system protein VirB6